MGFRTYSINYYYYYSFYIVTSIHNTIYIVDSIEERIISQPWSAYNLCKHILLFCFSKPYLWTVILLIFLIFIFHLWFSHKLKKWVVLGITHVISKGWFSFILLELSYWEFWVQSHSLVGALVCMWNLKKGVYLRLSGDEWG